MGLSKRISQFKESQLASSSLKFVYQQRLMTQVLLLGILAAVAHVILDAYHRVWVGVGIDMVLLFNIVLIYLFNRRGYFIFSRLYLVVFINLAFYVVANMVPRSYGMYFLFMPMVCLPFVLFEYHKQLIRWTMSLLPIILILALEVTGYESSIIPYRITGDHAYSFLLNYLSAAVTLYFIVDFMVKAHLRAESNLEHNQERLRTLTEDLGYKNRQLEKANKELDRFVYSASHDLKAPLASIKGLIDLARRDEMPAEVDYLNMMEERVDHLEKFIFEITTYSRNSRQVVNPEYLAVPELIDEVVRGLRFMPGAELIRLQIDDRIGAPVFADKYRLTIILNNLISNAIKYHRLDREDPFIRIELVVKNGSLLMTVEDNGPGIPAEQTVRIFEMFYRGAETSDGTGLGLYIAREVAERLNGSIVVDSVSGTGTRFTFSMPLEQPRLQDAHLVSKAVFPEK
ncbi:sensor histidine kinase [Roseivirga sp. BDSF3-8]|uniref:sensor histidine kinase n=1 Tax=Roseivirga sp. BDSF3-8 TaxID=3241598 RepID=UPI003531ADAE